MAWPTIENEPLNEYQVSNLATIAKWIPSKSSVICSAHFTPDDFVRKFAGFAEKELKYDARLKRDDIGISAIPSVYLKEEEIMSIRERRQVRCTSIFFWDNVV